MPAISSHLPAVGTVSYNGFTFPSALTMKIRQFPIPSPDGRIVKLRRYHVSIECIITADDFVANLPLATDWQTAGVANPNIAGLGLAPSEILEKSAAINFPMEKLRLRLMEYGKTLTLNGQGFGNNLIILGDDSNGITYGVNTIDAEFGPKPSVLMWSSAGSDKAAHIVWECEFTIHECESAGIGRFAAFGYNIAWNFSHEGQTVRTITGQAEAIVKRRGPNGSDARSIVNTADALREHISFPPLPGFHRTQHWALSEDRRILQFSITDSEIPSDNAYFPYCVRMSVRHRISSGMTVAQGGFLLWRSSFSGNIQVAPGVHKSLGWTAFVRTISNRLQAAESGQSIEGTGGSFRIMTDFDMEEEIFDRSMHFSMTYLFNCRPSQLVQCSGMWLPVEIGNDWTEWQTSMEAINSNRGTTNMGHTASDDVLVNPCYDAQLFPPNSFVDKPQLTEATPVFESEPVDEDKSYLKYHNGYDVYRVTSIATHKPLGPSDATSAFVPKELTRGDDGQILPKAVIQERGVSEWVLSMTGGAIRVGHLIPTPYVYLLNGKPPKLKSEQISGNQVVGMAGDHKIYKATWERLYSLENGTIESIAFKGVPEQYKTEDNRQITFPD